MRIQTILNRVEKFKPFVVGGAILEERDDGPILVVQIEPRKNGRAFCSGCGGSLVPCSDGLEERRFEFVPLWGIVMFLAYRMRRVDCKRCGVTVEMVPWCDGKNQLTTTYRWYLATWAKRLSWGESRLHLPHVVGQCLPGGGTRGGMEAWSTGDLSKVFDGFGCGRDCLGQGAHVSDAFVRHRRRGESGCWPSPRNGEEASLRLVP